MDEALFGYEVVERMSAIVKEWVTIYRDREAKKQSSLKVEPGTKPAGAGNEPKPK
ncbi:MAG TPA: hypothetical protein VHD56_17760 [Tepidisphaeraceae bacterium]|nr:hypothetical protein [Tepidisphaeraceae bacterium]